MDGDISVNESIMSECASEKRYRKKFQWALVNFITFGASDHVTILLPVFKWPWPIFAALGLVRGNCQGHIGHGIRRESLRLCRVSFGAKKDNLLCTIFYAPTKGINVSLINKFSIIELWWQCLFLSLHLFPSFKLIFSCQIIHFFELTLEFIIIQDYINYLIRKNSNWNNIYF